MMLGAMLDRDLLHEDIRPPSIDYAAISVDIKLDWAFTRPLKDVYRNLSRDNVSKCNAGDIFTYDIN